VKTWSYFLTIP